MISTTTKIQLLIFAIVTVIGATIVGGRYAQVDRLVIDRTYPVKVNLEDSGGIFAGAEVTYRGIPVGKVDSMEYIPSGVRATLAIEKDAPKISADTIAVVANKSAIGEQFMDLQPRSNSGPFLRAGSTIPASNTVVPLDVTKLLIDVGALVDSVDTESLQTLVSEVGVAFAGYGRDLSVIIDTFQSFIRQANTSFPETRSLIRGSGTVLETLVDKRSQFADLNEDLTKLTDTLVEEDDSIRDLLDDGPEAAAEVRTVVQENSSDLTSIFNSLTEVTRVLDKRWKSIEVLSILYPLIIDGGFGYMQDSPDAKRAGMSDGRIGLILTPLNPAEYPEQMCLPPGDGNFRTRRPADDLTTAPVGHFDCENENKVPFNPEEGWRPGQTGTEYNFNRSVTAPSAGEDSWKWLLVGMASN